MMTTSAGQPPRLSQMVAALTGATQLSRYQFTLSVAGHYDDGRERLEALQDGESLDRLSQAHLVADEDALVLHAIGGARPLGGPEGSPPRPGMTMSASVARDASTFSFVSSTLAWRRWISAWISGVPVKPLLCKRG